MSRIYPLADRIVPGGIDAYLRGRRAAGESSETIARQLAAEHGISVSSETVRTWLRALDAEVAL